MPPEVKMAEENNQSWSLESLTALVIDQDEIFTTRVAHYIREDRKYHFSVESCSIPADALKLCEASAWDIVLLDQNLPGMSAVSFLLELEARMGWRAPPVIVLSAVGGDKAAGEAIRANAMDFIPKEVVTRQSLSRSMDNAIYKDRLKKSIHQHTLQLQEKNSELTMKNQEIQFFYQKVSHEIKTPLAAAREFVSLVRDGISGAVNNEQAEYLDYAIASCDQLTTHFNDLVEIMRLDADKVLLRRSVTSIDALLKRSIAACTAALKQDDIEIALSVDDADREIYVDPNRVTQVISNLIGNAIKYSPAGSTITISVGRDGDGHDLFCVSDDGCGIEEEHASKIFKRLYQVCDEKHEFMGAGLGLGLSIAREIVLLHQGEIWVESIVGKGSDFYFYLPRTAPETAADLPDTQA